MTRFEYLQLRDMLEASTQRKIALERVYFSYVLLFVWFCIAAYVFFILPYGDLSHFLCLFASLSAILVVVFYVEFLSTREKAFKTIVKLGESWEQKKTVEETLALPEFAKLFPEKPRVGGIEFH